MDNLMYYDPYMLFADFASYRRLPGEGVGNLPRRRALDADVDPQHRKERQILIGSHDPRILRRHLAREAVPIHLLTQSEAGSA